MSNVALLCRFVTGAKHDHDYPAPTNKVQAVAWPEMNPHLRNFALYQLPVPQVARFGLPQPSGYSDLSTTIGKCVKPRDKLFCLTNREHGLNVFNWIHFVNTADANDHAGLRWAAFQRGDT